MNLILLIGLIVFGLIWGSFLNVCIYRLPLKKSIIFPASSCPNCGNKIYFYDNIPVFSYIFLKGKCRFCKKPISFRYPLVEILTAVVLVISYLKFGWGWDFAAKFLLFSGLIVLSFIDWEHKILPDVLTLPLLGLGIIFSFFTSQISILQSLLGVLAGGLTLFLTAWLGEKIFKKEALGGGDIKLAAMLGAFLGWQNVLLLFILAALLGSLYGISFKLFFANKSKESSVIPFGPFLSLAAVLVSFFGPEMIEFYIQHYLN